MSLSDRLREALNEHGQGKPGDAPLSIGSRTGSTTITTGQPREIDDRRDRLGKNLLSIGDAVIVTDSLGNVILLNPAAEALTGWTDRDARDRPIETVFRIIHEATRQPVIQPVKEVIEHGIIQNLAPFTLLIAKDGSERAIDDSASPIRDAKGELDAVVLIFRDTTERRQLERQHEEERHHGEVIIAAVKDALLVLDGALRVRSANRAFYEIFRTSQPETIGRSFCELGDGQWDDDGLRGLLEEILSRATSSGEFRVERDFPSIGERIMLINARQLNGKDGREMMVLLAIEDITGRSRLADSLATSEVRFRRLFEAAKDGILILDAETGAIEDANPFLLELLGYSRAEILGKHLWDIGLFGDIEASRASFRELQEKGYVRYEDLPLETKDGRHVEVEVVSNVYRVNDHMIIQCNIRDVTTRKRAEAEQKQAQRGDRGVQPGQGPVPRHAEPRAAHPADAGAGDHLLRRDDAGPGRRGDARADRLDPPQHRAGGATDRRPAGRDPDRQRQARVAPGGPGHPRDAAGRPGGLPGRDRGQEAGGLAGAAGRGPPGLGGSGPHPAGLLEPDQERREVHGRRRAGSASARRTSARGGWRSRCPTRASASSRRRCCGSSMPSSRGISR